MSNQETLTPLQETMNAAIESAFPWLDKTDSLGESWTWTKEDSLARGYGKDCPDMVACIGFEDACWLFEEHGKYTMYEAIEVLQEEFKRKNLPYWLEPHYSFLWLVHHDEAGAEA